MNAYAATVSYIGRARFAAPDESRTTLDLRRTDTGRGATRPNAEAPLEFAPPDAALVDQIEAALCLHRYERDRRRRAAGDPLHPAADGVTS